MEAIKVQKEGRLVSISNEKHLQETQYYCTVRQTSSYSLETIAFSAQSLPVFPAHPKNRNTRRVNKNQKQKSLIYSPAS